MPADASIYSMIRPQAQAPGPLDQYAQTMTLRNLMGQQDLQGMQIAAGRRDMETQDKLRDLFARNPNPDATAIGAIDPQYAQKYKTGQLANQKTEGEINNQRLEAIKKTIETGRERIANIGSDAALMQLREEIMGRSGPQAVADMPASVNDPRFKEWQLTHVMKADELVKRLSPELRMTDTGGGITPTNPYTGAQQPGTAIIPKTQTPESKASVGLGYANLAETKKNNLRPVYDIDRGGFASRPEPGKESTFTPAIGAPKGQKELIANREDADNLRKEFEAKPSVKNYRDVLPIAAAGQKSPDTRAGDIQMAYAVGKILDPNSVVREGELKLVGEAATVLQKVEGELRTLTQGKGRLTPETRAELNAMLSNAVAQRQASFDAEKKSFEGIVQRRGYKPEDIFIDTPRPAAPPPVPPKPGAGRGKFLGFE